MVPLRVPLLRRCPTPLYLLDHAEKGDRELARRGRHRGHRRIRCRGCSAAGPLDTGHRSAGHDSAQATQAPRHVPCRPHSEAGDPAYRQQLGTALRGRRPSGLPVHEPARVRAGGLRTPRQRADTELHSAVVQVSEVVRRRDGASRRNQGPPSGGQVLDRRHGRALRRSGHLEDPQVWREGGSRALRSREVSSRRLRRIRSFEAVTRVVP